MNIKQEALYHYFQNNQVETRYFSSEDYKRIVDKSEVYRNKNGNLPSINFLFEYSNKLSDDSEQVNRLEDILYSIQKYKPELESIQEINELLLEDYKKDKIRDLTKKLALSQTEEKWGLADTLAREIGEISRLELSSKDFIENDIKSDILEVSTKVDLVPTGFFSDKNYSISNIPRGSMILALGSTGQGKTLLTMAAAVERYLQGSNEIMISYELPKQQCIARIKSYITKVPISEIMTGVFTTEDSKLLLKASDFVLKRRVDIDTAYHLMCKDPNHTFEEFEIRPNYFKIIAALDAESFKKKKGKGQALEELPTDIEILNMITEFGDTLDYITIDLVSEINFTDKFLSTEQQLTIFGRRLKELCLLTSTNSIIVSQPENEKAANNLIYPKYSKALRSSCDMNLVLLATAEMEVDNMVAVCCEKTRHAVPNKAYICDADRSTMTFTPLDETYSIWQVIDEISKSLKKKNNEK